MQDIFLRWIDLLADSLFGLQEQRRARHALLITREGDHFVAHRRDKDQDIVVARVPVGAKRPDQWQGAHNRLTTFELSPEELVVQQITVPVQAREFVPGIIRNQIDRLSPWPRDQAAYGFEARVSAEDATTLDVSVFITSRQAVETTQAELAASGLALDRIAARPPAMPGTLVTMWSRLVDTSQDRLKRTRRTIIAAIASTVAISALISGWAFMSAGGIGDETAEVDTKIAALERKIQGSRSPSLATEHNPVRRAWIEKDTSRSAVLALETLSAALPDTAYVTELDLDKSALRLVGLANDAPSLITPLEHSGALNKVHFFAPTTRGPDGSRFWFHIEAQIKPHTDAGKD